MTKLLPAVYEHGSFRPLEPFSLPEHAQVLMAVAIPTDDIPTLLINKSAESSDSFRFLSGPGEDIYTPADGEEV